MSEDNTDMHDFSNNNEELVKLVSLSEMYEDWFLDYASYVILERSVPFILDGLKPVQRRILHTMKEMDDGKFCKVANIVGFAGSLRQFYLLIFHHHERAFNDHSAHFASTTIAFFRTSTFRT